MNHQLRYSEWESSHDEDTARACAQAQLAGLEQIVSLVDELEIDCDLERRSHFVRAENDDERDQAQAEVEAEQRAGLNASFVEDVDLPFTTRGAAVLEDQAQLHPRRYVLGLADVFVKAGGTLFEQTRVQDVTDGEPCVVGNWSLRTADEGTHLLIVVGEAHKVGEGGDTETHYEALQEWLRERFHLTDVRYRWTTHDLTPVDGLPYIGKVGSDVEHLYVATGFAGWGMTNGTWSAMLLRDLITGVGTHLRGLRPESPRPPDRHRHVPVGGPEGGEALGGGSRLHRGTAGDHLDNGEAAIVTHDGLEHIAAFRDDEGRLHAVSATCTHMGCLVGWNGAERTWDCPCHGSRSDIDGAVVEAPAVEPLAPRSIDEAARAPSSQSGADRSAPQAFPLGSVPNAHLDWRGVACRAVEDPMQPLQIRISESASRGCPRAAQRRIRRRGRVAVLTSHHGRRHAGQLSHGDPRPVRAHVLGLHRTARPAASSGGCIGEGHATRARTTAAGGPSSGMDLGGVRNEFETLESFPDA